MELPLGAITWLRSVGAESKPASSNWPLFAEKARQLLIRLRMLDVSGTIAISETSLKALL
jgi:hypothetical protein